jgi:hypothetical protein
MDFEKEGPDMTSANRKCLLGIDRRSIVAIAAGILIGMGLALQWTEVIVSRLFGPNSWFLATLLAQAWNMMNVWMSAQMWQQEISYLPLLLVITGGAILFSLCPKGDCGK